MIQTTGQGLFSEFGRRHLGEVWLRRRIEGPGGTFLVASYRLDHEGPRAYWVYMATAEGLTSFGGRSFESRRMAVDVALHLAARSPRPPRPSAEILLIERRLSP